MKSKTSSCKATLLKKDITRFAPAWALYAVFLGMCLLMMTDDTRYWFVRNVEDSMQIMAVLNMIFAFLSAQLLFGDLYNPRMCNALHALPVGRDSWCGIHTAAGLLFALVPYALFSGLGLLLLGEHSVVALAWLLAVVGQYVCFFGIGVFSIMCAGSRFAMLVVYGIINFFAVIVYWMVSNMYEPLLPGISLDLEWMLYLMPAAALASGVDYLNIEQVYNEQRMENEIVSIAFGEDWIWVAVYAAAGIALLWLALVLYRRRKLEVAGDFIAVRQLEPVFLVLFTLSAGNVCQIFCQLFGYDQVYYLFLAVGMTVGFFVALMLLKRTVRVFTLKAVLRLGCLGAVVALTVLVTWLDPLGVTRWVPEQEEVTAVTVWGSSYKSDYESHFTLTEAADIAAIRNIHSNAIEARVTDTDDYDSVGFAASADAEIAQVIQAEQTAETGSVPVNPGTYMPIVIEYTLENGRTVDRYYYVFTTDPDGKTLESYFSMPHCVLGFRDMTPEQFLEKIVSIEVEDTYFTGQDMQALVEAILADCEAGTMAQPWSYHIHEDTAYWITFQYKEAYVGEYMRSYEDVRVYERNENAYGWLQEQGVLSQQEKYGN